MNKLNFIAIDFETASSPFSYKEDREIIANAFKNMWGLDVSKANIVNSAYMSFEKL